MPCHATDAARAAGPGHLAPGGHLGPLLAPHPGDYFTAAGGAAAPAAPAPPSLLAEATSTALALGGGAGGGGYGAGGARAGGGGGPVPPSPSQLNGLAVAAGVGGVGEPGVKAHGGGGSVGASSLYALFDGGGGGEGGGGPGGGGQWRPRGVLLGHLMEHRKAVTQMAVGAQRVGGRGAGGSGAADEGARPMVAARVRAWLQVAHGGHFFVSASADKTVKVGGRWRGAGGECLCASAGVPVAAHCSVCLQQDF